eukprot:1159869-Pelagomonas_calceolata.AAC.8
MIEVGANWSCFRDALFKGMIICDIVSVATLLRTSFAALLRTSFAARNKSSRACCAEAWAYFWPPYG